MLNLKPSEIRFSQDSINNYFDQRSAHSYRSIGQTLDDLCERRCRVSDIPTITVVKEDGHWITADNRRLWVFRQLERLGKCDTIPVRTGYYIPAAKRTSYNDGTSISVRRNPGGRWHLKPSVRKPSMSEPPVTCSSISTSLSDSRDSKIESTYHSRVTADDRVDPTKNIYSNPSTDRRAISLSGYGTDRVQPVQPRLQTQSSYNKRATSDENDIVLSFPQNKVYPPAPVSPAKKISPPTYRHNVGNTESTNPGSMTAQNRLNMNNSTMATDDIGSRAASREVDTATPRVRTEDHVIRDRTIVNMPDERVQKPRRRRCFCNIL